MTALMLAAAILAAEAKPPEKHIVFDPDEIGGLRDGPDIEYITPRKPPKFGNLIKIRENFHDKIIRSVDQM